MKVNIWQEEVIIPTHEVGKAEKTPIFLEKRVYQGSSGKVYPNPVIEKIYDEKIDKSYQAVYLENKYVKIMVLPELGGRVQMAYDKVKERHFVYYNNVIKPALVGLTGPWISGGIEFNWPQHHRPSTFEATDFSIEEHEDGAKTVWCSEIEKMSGQKGMAGFTLHPDKAYLEIRVQLYNRTALPQTFLWWANPAVAVNDDYRSVFPPDVYGVYDHGKRDVSKFPIASGTYYKIDYSSGVDISRYKNIPVPTSYMAVESRYDFMGGYENDSKGGLLHVADRNISPGKKQWTWGHGDFGQAWDRNLTDEDGPYIEIMCGVYTDNQPDFTWLMPNEQKSFVQYFMPYQELGLVKNASKEAMLNMEFEGECALFQVYVTGEYKNLTIQLRHKSEVLYSKTLNMTPEKVLKAQQILPKDYVKQDVVIEVMDADGKSLVAWSPDKEEIHPAPPPAEAIPEPEDLKTTEELFLSGLHLEQYRHATYDPMPYYDEALKRDKNDLRCNNAKGLLLMRRGAFEEAKDFFKRAVSKLTQHNPNPYDGEPFYNLGLCEKHLGEYDDAYKHFYKATWNAAWQDSAYFALAQIACMKSDYTLALQHVEASLERNTNSHKARSLKVAILRKLDKNAEALAWIKTSLGKDKFNMSCRFEQYLIEQKQGDKRAQQTLEGLQTLMRGHANSYVEYAIDYGNAGFFAEAIQLLELLKKESPANHLYPMAAYFMGHYALKDGQETLSERYFKIAREARPDYCFPSKLEEIAALQSAIDFHQQDGMAHYYLGNLYYDKRQYKKAIGLWEEASKLVPEFPIVWRNLSLAYYNKLGKKEEALRFMEKAFALEPSDARILMELDQLYKKTQKQAGERLTFLEKYKSVVEERDDLYLELISLHNIQGHYAKAYELIMKRQFHPWEGGEGKVVGQYLFSVTEIGKKHLSSGDAEQALEWLNKTNSYPHNLGEGKLTGVPENDINYWKALAYKSLKDEEQAKRHFKLALQGDSEPVQAFFYNDPQPDKILYQGLALRELGDEKGARSIFNRMVNHGEKHLFDKVKIDYFAVSLPDLAIFDEDFNVRNQVHCHYILGLAYFGLGDMGKARDFLSTVLSIENNHFGAKLHIEAIAH